MELEEIPYEIRYRPGSQNALPDYLSRGRQIQLDEEVNIEDEFEGNVCMVENQEQWVGKLKKAQREDVVIRNTVAQLQKSGSVVHGQLKKVAPKLKVIEGALYLQNRLVVPKMLQQEVLERLHSETHFWQTRTLRLLRRSYFWKNMSRDARAYCRSCLVCQRPKPSQAPKQPLELFEAVGTQHGITVAGHWNPSIVDIFSHYIEAVQKI